MPVSVKPEEVPTFVRAGTVTQYPDILNYAAAWLRDPKRATKEAVAYTGLTPEQAELPEDKQPETDGITKENWGAIASALRRVAKDAKVKLAIVFREDEMRLYVKHNGDFVPLTPEQIKQRAAKRRSNKITALTEKYVKEGMTEANAAKRASEEVGKLPVV
jgi:hypothetical protein